MSDDNKLLRGNRRQYLRTVGAGVFAGLAGCMGGDDGDGTGGSGGDGGDGGTSGGDGGSGSSGGDDGGSGGSTGTPGSSVDEVVIGGNHPLSGALSSAGTAMSNAGKVAAMHINEGGIVPGFDDGGIPNLDGATVRFVSRDNEGTQELGAEVHNQLLDEGAVIFTGCYSSPVTLAATQVAEREGVPHIIDVSVANEILQGRGMDYTYRIQTPASGMAGNYAEFMPALARENGQTMDTASLVYLDNAFGQSIRNTLQDVLPEQDVELVDEMAFSFGKENMDTEATRVKQADADAFIFVGYGGGGTRMMESLQNVDYRPPLLTGTSTPTFTDEDVIAQIGRFANGGFGNNYEFDYSLEWTDRIFADYRVEYGRPLGVTHSVMTYTMVVVAANAINEAGSDDPEEINQALENITVEDHPAASGPVTFQDNGENANALSPMLQVQNLEANVVWPEEYAQADVQFD